MIRKLLFSTFLMVGISQMNAQASLNFDGVDDVVTGPTSPISSNNPRTVEAWIKTTKNSLPTGSGGQGQSVIVDWGSAPANGARFTFNILFSNAIRLEVAGHGISGTTAVNDGNWHHVAVTYENGANPAVKLYVDGNLDASGNLNVTVNTSPAGNVKIGQRVDGISPFQGSIDEVKIWNFAKTQAQIQADMNKEFCSTQTGLVLYYKFNEGTPSGTNTSVTTINDYSSNNTDGTATNFAMTGASSNFDSSPTLALTTVDNTVTQANELLTANQSGANYQWYFGCNQPIPGANTQSYTAAQNGTYSVMVELNGCMTMSTCMTVSSLSVSDVKSNPKTFQVYPNPSEAEFNFVFERGSNPRNIVVYDASGKLIKKMDNFKRNENGIQLDFDAPKGNYFIQIETEDGKIQQTKLIKK